MDKGSQLEATKKTEATHPLLTVKVITDETFSRHEGFDLACFDEKSWLASNLSTFRVSKTESYSTLKDMVARHFKYTTNQVRLWVVNKRVVGTVRPVVPIPDNEPALTVGVILKKLATHQTHGLRLYLDVIPDPSKSTIQPRSVTIFLKHFNASKQTLCGVGKVNVFREAKVGDLVPVINERMKWTIGTRLKLYEEVKPGLIELMRPRLSFAQSELQDGDIICFQVDLPEKELHNLEAKGSYSDPPQFYDFLQNRVMVTFKHKAAQAGHPEFSLVLSKKHDHNFMAAKVGKHLGHDPAKLRFTTTHTDDGLPKSVLHSSLNQSIKTIMASDGISLAKIIILYEKLDTNVVELETMANTLINLFWVNAHNQTTIAPSASLLFPKTGQVHELTNHISKLIPKLVKLTPNGSQQIRIFQISDDGKTQIEFAGANLVGNYPNRIKLYAEEIPKEELEINGTDKIITVFHFSKKLSQTHGVPFKFVIKQGEKFVDTKKRLQARVGAPDAEFARYRFALILPLAFKHPLFIDDGDSIYETQFSPHALRLDHEPPKSGGKRTTT